MRTLGAYLDGLGSHAVLEAAGSSSHNISQGLPVQPPPFLFDSGRILGSTALGADVAPHPPLLDVDRGGVVLHQLSISPPLAGAHPHYHGTAYNALIVGRRRWALRSPTHATFAPQPALEHFMRLRHKLANVAAAVASIDGNGTVSLAESEPDDTENGVASPWVDVIQVAGDLLYLPSQWGHATLSLAESVAVAVEYV